MIAKSFNDIPLLLNKVITVKSATQEKMNRITKGGNKKIIFTINKTILK